VSGGSVGGSTAIFDEKKTDWRLGEAFFNTH